MGIGNGLTSDPIQKMILKSTLTDVRTYMTTHFSKGRIGLVKELPKSMRQTLL